MPSSAFISSYHSFGSVSCPPNAGYGLQFSTGSIAATQVQPFVSYGQVGSLASGLAGFVGLRMVPEIGDGAAASAGAPKFINEQFTTHPLAPLGV